MSYTDTVSVRRDYWLTTCDECGDSVYFLRPSNGGSLWLDEMGWPWPKHPCKDNNILPGERFGAIREVIASASDEDARKFSLNTFHIYHSKLTRGCSECELEMSELAQACSTSYPKLNSMMRKVLTVYGVSIGKSVSRENAYTYTQTMHDENPQASAKMSDDAQFQISSNAFDQLPFIYYPERPRGAEEYVRMLGLIKGKRYLRWIRGDYLSTPESFGSYRIAVSAANHSGELEGVLSKPAVIGPGVAVTQAHITIGRFDNELEAAACLRYIKTKFARALLGALNVAQHNPAEVWKYVPDQDFTPTSEIDWAQSIPNIDQQLFAKYRLSDAETDFIEAKIRPME